MKSVMSERLISGRPSNTSTKCRWTGRLGSKRRYQSKSSGDPSAISDVMNTNGGSGRISRWLAIVSSVAQMQQQLSQMLTRHGNEAEAGLLLNEAGEAERAVSLFASLRGEFEQVRRFLDSESERLGLGNAKD